MACDWFKFNNIYVWAKILPYLLPWRHEIKSVIDLITWIGNSNFKLKKFDDKEFLKIFNQKWKKLSVKKFKWKYFDWKSLKKKNFNQKEKEYILVKLCFFLFLPETSTSGVITAES